MGGKYTRGDLVFIVNPWNRGSTRTPAAAASEIQSRRRDWLRVRDLKKRRRGTKSRKSQIQSC